MRTPSPGRRRIIGLRANCTSITNNAADKLALMEVNPKNQSIFIRFAHTISKWAGTSSAFLLALFVIMAWGVTGPMFDFSDTWQLVINTGTTIVTFLMVFLIQNTQNRDTQALQLKLDELLRATKGAHLSLLDLEELNDEELENFRRMYRELAEYGRHRLGKGKSDTNQPELKREEFLNASKAYKESHKPLHERVKEPKN